MSADLSRVDAVVDAIGELVHVITGNKRTVHLAHIRGGFAFPCCGGRFRIGYSCETTGRYVTCRTCCRSEAQK